MSRVRWFRGSDDELAFDWSRAARELDVSLDVARALYLRAIRVAIDAQRAEALYLRWLRDAAAARRPAAPPHVPGRQTRVMRERGNAGRSRQPDLENLAPGRWTRVLLETSDDESHPPGFDDVQLAIAALASGAATASSTPQGSESGPALHDWRVQSPPHGPTPTESTSGIEALRERLREAATSGQGPAAVLTAAEPATAAAALRELRNEHVPAHTAPVLRLVTRAADGEVERVLARGSAGTALPADLSARLGPHVGAEAAGAAQLHTDDAADLVAASHHARALTLGNNIYFAHGEYAPGTERGDELLAHELTHVAQSQRGELVRAAAKGIDSGGVLDPAEAEADLRARLAVVQLHPPEAAVPPLAAPSGQPTTDGDRGARVAAQQQRISLADAAAAPLALSPAPPASSPQAPVPNPLPTVVVPPTPPPTGNAYVDTLQALPSRQAMELWDTAGTQATTQAAADQAAFDASLPEMPVELDGCEAPASAGAPAGSRQPAGATPPAAGAVPADAAAALPVVQKAVAQVSQVVAAIAALFAPKPSVDQTQAQSQAQADGRQAINSLPTTAPDVNTNPGTAPMTDLAGQSDPVRVVGDRQQAVADGAKAFDDIKLKIVTGPGAAQVQPLKLDEKLTIPKEQAIGAMPALPPVEGMAKLKKWNLPPAAQAPFDQIAKPRMDASLAEARTQMTQAESTRDTDRAKAVADTEEKIKQAHADADKQQQTKVAESRTRITNYQTDTLVKQENEIKKLDEEAGTRKRTTIGKINDRISTDQAQVDSDYKDAQRRADDRKRQGEDDAAKKKKDAQDKAGDPSWWDQIAGAICDAIQAIADDICKILDGIAQAIGQIIDGVKNAACKLIDAARDFVCQALTEFGEWAKSAVTALIGTVFPEAAAAINRWIDDEVNQAKTFVNTTADNLKAGVTALCDGLKGAIEAVLSAFKSAVQAAATLAKALISGDWAAVGKMFLDGILQLLGIDPGAFYALIAKAMDSIDKIIEDPGAFVGHLIDAVKLGFQQFGDNFWTHLKSGVVQWLFGTFAQAGITMPATFDVAGIFDLVCQILGLTWPRLRGKIVKLIGEKNAERLEFVAQYIQALITGGFAGLWEKIQQDLSNLWDMVVGGIRDWIIQTVVQQAILKIATMWNPIGAIIQLIQTAWNVYQWVKENAQRIFGLVQAVVDSISNIVAGDITGAANFIESSLAKLVPIAISLFANLIGLGGIADQIKGVIEKVQDTVDQAIDKLIDRVMGMFKGKGDGKGDGVDGDKKDGAVGTRVTFQVHGETHTQYIDMSSGSPVPMVASTPSAVKAKIAEWRLRLKELPEVDKKRAGQLIGKAIAIEGKVDELATATRPGEKNQVLEAKQHELAETLNTAWEAVFPDAADFAKRFNVVPPDTGTRVQPHGSANVHMDPPAKPPMLGNEKLPAYVIAMASTPREVSADMATRFSGQRNTAWKGSDLKSLAKLRTAVVVGINSFRSIDPKKEETDMGKIEGTIGKVRYPSNTVMAVFGFAWEPHWTDGGAASTVDAVRTEWQALPTDQHDAARQETEATVTAQDHLPYGMIRNQVVDTYGKQAASALSHAWDPVHVLIQDADGGTQAESGLGILAEYDKVLEDIARHPLMVIGGYRFKGFDWGEAAGSRTQQLTELANEIDRAIRAAIATIEPKGLYPTEPNLLIKGIDQQHGDGIYDRDLTNVFGVKKAEGRTARRNILKADARSGDPNPEPIRYEPSTSIVTSPVPGSRDRGFTVFDDSVPAASSGKTYSDVSGETDPEVIAANSHPAVALEMQRQSYLNPRTLEREVGHGIGLHDDQLTSDVYQQVAEAGRTLSDPHLTPEQRSAQIARHQAAVDTNVQEMKELERYGENKPKNRENLEKTRRITQAIISAMLGEELGAKWEQLRQLFQEIEEENNQRQSR